jgi:hypothetical protein
VEAELAPSGRGYLASYALVSARWQGFGASGHKDLGVGDQPMAPLGGFTIQNSGRVSRPNGETRGRNYNFRCASCVRDLTSSFRNALCR